MGEGGERGFGEEKKKTKIGKVEVVGFSSAYLFPTRKREAVASGNRGD